MFLAPVLYLIHAVLTGLSMVVTYVLGIQHGFGFSAGAIDYFLNYGLATKPFLIIPLGIAAFVIYYALFRFVIEKFDVSTPGRVEAEKTANEMSVMPEAQKKGSESSSVQSKSSKASQYIEALGGAENITSVDACITRLRLEVRDSGELDENKLKQLGASGILKANKTNAQVVVGTKAELIAEEIKKELNKLNK
jgi:PTS system N-acetylglucosamine-specific IIC component